MDQSFHFVALREGDTLREAIDRREDWLATETGLRSGVRVLELVCGMGRPLHHLARAAGANITVVNVGATQVARVRRRADAADRSGLVAVEREDLVERPFADLPFADLPFADLPFADLPFADLPFADLPFADLPFADHSFDVVLAIESTCHAPDRLRTFEEAYRVLKPGGRFAGYDWCTRDAYDPNRVEHARIIRAIELGNSLPPLVSTHVVYEALYVSGFEIRESHDAAEESDPNTPWWMVLNSQGDLRKLPGTPFDRVAAKAMLQPLEPRRETTAFNTMSYRTMDAIIAGGHLGIFTPLYRWSAIRHA